MERVVEHWEGRIGVPNPGGVRETPGCGTQCSTLGMRLGSVILELFSDLNDPKIWGKFPHFPLSPVDSHHQPRYPSWGRIHGSKPAPKITISVLFFSKYQKIQERWWLVLLQPSRGAGMGVVTFLSLFIHAEQRRGARRPARELCSPRERSFISILPPSPQLNSAGLFLLHSLIRIQSASQQSAAIVTSYGKIIMLPKHFHRNKFHVCVGGQ